MSRIEFIIGNENGFNRVHKFPAWRLFDERAIDFCSDLSQALIKEKKTRLYPDLTALAFWLRKSSIQALKENYSDLEAHIGKGLVFHIAPGNVALSFAYSMLTGILTGNTNIIRLPSRRFEQADIFLDVLKDVLMKNNDIYERIFLIRYPHDRSITDEISKRCRLRVIWGGDNTVNTIRKSPLAPRAGEITFANRFSVCMINADRYLVEYDPKKTAHDFYIDTYLSDQNACSSPRIIFWMGDRINEAKDIFWHALSNEINEYQMAAVTTCDKLLTYCKYAAYSVCHMSMAGDYRIMRIAVSKADSSILDNIGNCGYFYECNISDWNEILPICRWELQTLSYIGMDGERLRNFIIDSAPDGVDRIVPVGRTMDFGLIWDGRDVVREMTRQISLK